MTFTPQCGRRHTLHLLGALIGLSTMLGGCHTASEQMVASGAADDYRLRHPIAITEATKTTVVFVGHGRGGLSATQRDDVMGLARTWVREGTGGVVAEVPVDSPNAKAAASTMHDIRSVLMAGGVPASGIATRPYRPANPQELTPIRLSYTRIAATAGPCGTWPDDLGPNIDNPLYGENKQYYNFGCATQRNLAAMVANPSDLVQPRAETPAYTMRRTEGFEKYRQGNSTATAYPESEKAKLSDVGKQ
ncbi:MAG TPA: CpaD family pilus assembly protein [Bradyrhizobium sp.]